MKMGQKHSEQTQWVSNYTEQHISDMIYTKAKNQFRGISADLSKSTNQREWMCTILRRAAEDLGYSLASDSNDTAFSKHGSRYERTFPNQLNDLDIYLVFHGEGLYFNGKKMYGSPFIQPNNFNLPFYPDSAIFILEKIVKLALSRINWLSSKTRIKLTKRGIEITNLGERNYDIIPAFMYYNKQGYINHFIPSKSGSWEKNPTEFVMKILYDFERIFPTDPTNKILSFKETVRVFKLMSKNLKWEEKGITSFIIKHIIIEYYEDIYKDFPNRDRPIFNQDSFLKIINIINYYIRRGSYLDPISKIYSKLNGEPINFNDAINEFMGKYVYYPNKI